jgi:RNA polymerase sigma-70 factor (ECF subfamily)
MSNGSTRAGQLGYDGCMRTESTPAGFAELVDRHRGELRVHCYRMVGSLDDAEDLVQETFLRAWRGLDRFEGRSSLRTWLYRIATNACLDALDGRARRVLPDALRPPSDPSVDLPPRTDVAWLEPIPDRLLDLADPAEVAGTRETIELAFVAAVQHLAPAPRAVLILRDVVGLPAREVAAELGLSVPAANSALHRARAALRDRLPADRSEWEAPEVSDEERAVVRRYMDALDRADLGLIAELLAEDVRTSMPPWPMWFRGRDAVLAALAASWDPALPGFVGRFRTVALGANRQPAGAIYARRTDDGPYLPFSLGVIRVERGAIAEIVAFHDTRLFAAFGLPEQFSDDPPST